MGLVGPDAIGESGARSRLSVPGMAGECLRDVDNEGKGAKYFAPSADFCGGEVNLAVN